MWPLGVLFVVPFGPGVLLWGPFWALGPKVEPPERTGKGTVVQRGCQEAFGGPPRPQICIACCDHKGREQQASKHQKVDSGDLCDRSLLCGFEAGECDFESTF